VAGLLYYDYDTGIALVVLLFVASVVQLVYVLSELFCSVQLMEPYYCF